MKTALTGLGNMGGIAMLRDVFFPTARHPC